MRETMEAAMQAVDEQILYLERDRELEVDHHRARILTIDSRLARLRLTRGELLRKLDDALAGLKKTPAPMELAPAAAAAPATRAAGYISAKTLVCPACSSTFVRTGNRQIVCDGCRAKWPGLSIQAIIARRGAGLEPLVEKPCPACSTVFLPKVAHQAICSPCREKFPLIAVEDIIRRTKYDERPVDGEPLKVNILCQGVGETACPDGARVIKPRTARGPLRCAKCYEDNRRRIVKESKAKSAPAAAAPLEEPAADDEKGVVPLVHRGTQIIDGVAWETFSSESLEAAADAAETVDDEELELLGETDEELEAPPRRREKPAAAAPATGRKVYDSKHYQVGESKQKKTKAGDNGSRGSWWTKPRTPEEFSETARAEQDRLSGSRGAGMVGTPRILCDQ